MNKLNYRLMVMSFEGDYQIEGRFNTIEDTWEYSNSIGSRWYFYPFHFVVTDKTVKSTPDLLKRFTNKRIATVAKEFKKYSKTDYALGMDVEEYAFYIM